MMNAQFLPDNKGLSPMNPKSGDACISIGEWTGHFDAVDRTIIFGDGRQTSEFVAQAMILQLGAKPMPQGANLANGIYFQMGMRLFEIHALLDTLIAAREKLIWAKANPPPPAGTYVDPNTKVVYDRDGSDSDLQDRTTKE